MLLAAAAGAAQSRPEAGRFVPADATLIQQLDAVLDPARGPDLVLAYAFGEGPDFRTGVRIVRRGRVLYEDKGFVDNGGGAGDALRLQKVKATGGREAVVVVLKFSGAGTATDWHVLASINGGIMELRADQMKMSALKRRGYVHMGYNGVKVDGDRVIENLTGYSEGQARCCPDRPPLELSFRFTGTALKLESVKKLPFHRPKDDRE
jgi:hypothetical protein